MSSLIWLYYSGYADRIYELMAVSRELHLVDEKSSLQRQGSRNCISEANYIEFSGVKASISTQLSINLEFILCLSCLEVMVHPNSGCDPHW